MPVRAPLPRATALHVLPAMKSISADCKWRPIADEGRAVTRKQPVGQISVQPRSENISLSRLVETALRIPTVPPHRGAYRDRHGRGEGCGGRGSVLRATGLQGGLAK